MEFPETPIPIIDNTHIEFNKLVLFKGEIHKAKKLVYIADIISLEGSKVRTTGEVCTRVYVDGDYFNVSEKYKKVKETWLLWLKWVKENSDKTNTMQFDNLKDANDSVIAICDHRKQALINLLYALDQYAHGSLAPEEFEGYEKIKNILIDRHSQHETV